MSTSRAKRKQAVGYTEDAPRCKNCVHYVPPVMRIEDSLAKTAVPPTCTKHGWFVKRLAWCKDHARVDLRRLPDGRVIAFGPMTIDREVG